MFNQNGNNEESLQPQNGSAPLGLGMREGGQSLNPQMLTSTGSSQSSYPSASMPPVPSSAQPPQLSTGSLINGLRTNQLVESITAMSPNDLTRALMALFQLAQSNAPAQHQKLPGSLGPNPNNLTMSIAAGLSGGGSSLDLLQGLQQHPRQLQQPPQGGGTSIDLTSQQMEGLLDQTSSSSDWKDRESIKSSPLSSSRKESEGTMNPFLVSSSSSGNNSGVTPPPILKLPCRARGMPVDHNFRTAHFTITPEVKHGDFLMCSYRSCCNDGIKFRYCATCQIPVAKRNFYQRHSHGISADDDRKKPASSQLGYGRGSEKAGVNEIKPSEQQASKNEAAIKTNLPRIRTEKTPSQSPSLPPKASSESDYALTAGGMITDRKNSTQGSSESDDTPSLGLKDKCTPSKGATTKQDSGFDNKDIAIDRQMRWSALLGNRPDSSDADAMSAWLLDVMAVSDLKTPLKNTGETSSSLTGSFTSRNESPQSYSSSVTTCGSSSGSRSFDNTDSTSETRDKRQDFRGKTTRDETHPRKRKRPRSSDYLRGEATYGYVETNER